jgi:AcrR family transcriptional regulator
VNTTREQLVRATWTLLTERGTADFTLAEVGRRAGVSRQAVYLYFSNRAELLVAAARDTDHRSGFVARVAASRSLPPDQAFETILRLWFGHLRKILPVARALEAAVIVGDDGAIAFRDRMHDWHETLRISIAALADAGYLPARWTVARATDWAWTQTHPATYDHLVTECGWSHKAATNQITDAVLGEFGRPLPHDSRTTHTPERRSVTR